jgi:hypothetical protein
MGYASIGFDAGHGMCGASFVLLPSTLVTILILFEWADSDGIFGYVDVNGTAYVRGHYLNCSRRGKPGMFDRLQLAC